MYQNRLFQPQLRQDSAGFCRIVKIPAWHPPQAATNALPAGLPSSQRYAPQRLPIGSCPTYGGEAAVQPGSDPQASPSATCQGAARKGWKSASSSHLTLRRNGASSGPAGTSAAPSLLGVLTQGRRCKKKRAEPINSATPSASCPSSTYWGYGPAGRLTRARQPALSLRRPPQHDLKFGVCWDRSRCRRTRARRPGSRRGQALSWPARVGSPAMSDSVLMACDAIV